MIIVLKIITGEEFMGTIEDEDTPIHEMQYVNLLDPMSIVDQKDEETGHSVMRLNDALLLSDEEYLTFNQKHVITYYKPAEKLCEYYTKATLYAKKYAKPRLHKQITQATSDIERTMQEENEGNAWSKFMKAAAIKPTKH